LWVIVCMKPVPDPKHRTGFAFDPKTNTLVRQGIPGAINPLDKNALEAALRLREEQGGEVIVVSMAPPDAKGVLNEALAMGADRLVLLSDSAFAGSDTLATSYVLSAGIKKLGTFDVVLCGDCTIDGGTAQVSAQLAEFLGVPNVMHVGAIDVAGTGLLAVRSGIEHGSITIEVPTPVVLSVVKEINKPRYVTMMNILEAEEKDCRIWSTGDLILPEPWVGLQGSPTRMGDFTVPERKKKAEMLKGEPEEQARILADRLFRLGFC
jgi:electron transfer flavoprotein beta subunit